MMMIIVILNLVICWFVRTESIWMGPFGWKTKTLCNLPNAWITTSHSDQLGNALLSMAVSVRRRPSRPWQGTTTAPVRMMRSASSEAKNLRSAEILQAHGCMEFTNHRGRKATSERRMWTWGVKIPSSMNSKYLMSQSKARLESPLPCSARTRKRRESGTQESQIKNTTKTPSMLMPISRSTVLMAGEFARRAFIDDMPGESFIWALQDLSLLRIKRLQTVCPLCVHSCRAAVVQKARDQPHVIYHRGWSSQRGGHHTWEHLRSNHWRRQWVHQPWIFLVGRPSTSSWVRDASGFYSLRLCGGREWPGEGFCQLRPGSRGDR